jgi:hypothetical protein
MTLYIILVDFEREKDFILNEQANLKNQIEQISINSMNERLIYYLKNEINNQQDLYNKYYTLNSEVCSKYRNLKESIPEFEEKVKKKSDKLKASK